MEAAGVAAAGPRSDAAQEVTGVRLRTALAASAVIHGVALLLAVRLGSAPLPPALVAFSVSLIAGTGGEGGGAHLRVVRTEQPTGSRFVPFMAGDRRLGYRLWFVHH